MKYVLAINQKVFTEEQLKEIFRLGQFAIFRERDFAEWLNKLVNNGALIAI